MKFPAAKGIKKLVNPAIFSAKNKKNITPKKAPKAEGKLKKRAFNLLNPPYNREVKSPISCGIS